VQNKKPSVGGVWIFSGTTRCNSSFHPPLEEQRLTKWLGVKLKVQLQCDRGRWGKGRGWGGGAEV